MSKRKKILLVADVRGWAFDYIAQYLSNLLKDRYNISLIYISDYKSHEEFLDYISSVPQIDLIHFFYRIYLKQLIHYSSLINPTNSKLEILWNTPITTGVPDSYFLNEGDIKENLSLFLLVDNYYTISTKLHRIYSNIKEYPMPWKEVIYNNITPPSDHVAKFTYTKNDKLIITWIGNSHNGEIFLAKTMI